MRILDSLHSDSYCPGFGHGFPTAAGNRSVDRAEFISSFRRSLMQVPSNLTRCKTPLVTVRFTDFRYFAP